GAPSSASRNGQTVSLRSSRRRGSPDFPAKKPSRCSAARALCRVGWRAIWFPGRSPRPKRGIWPGSGNSSKQRPGCGRLRRSARD
ncbi:MAG: COG1896: Predicted hydrolases of HD superfamily, partial [uncultured Microvirga sp.]